MQNYQNHIRYYTPHHFIFYPVALVLFGFTMYEAFTDVEHHLLWAFAGILVLLVTWVSLMLRQHYALTLQNRLVRLEVSYRYFVLTQQRLEKAGNLSFGQIAALRFASDEELPALVKRAVDEKLSPDDIKKSIKNWLADDNRV